MSKRRWKPETRREIVMRLRAEGKSATQIAKQLGISERTVHYDVAQWVQKAVQELADFAPSDCTGGETRGTRDEANRSRPDPRG